MTVRPAPTDWSVEEPSLAFSVEQGRALAIPAGDWTIGRAAKIEALVDEVIRSDAVTRSRRGDRRPTAGAGTGERAPITVDLGRIGRLDTLGALLLNRLFLAAGDRLSVANMSETQRVLIEQVVANDKPPIAPRRPDNALVGLLLSLGRTGFAFASESRQVLNILGGATAALVRWLTFRSRFRFAAYVTHLERTGLAAAPIIALMSFLIGGILAQQGTFYFRRFAADIYVVDLTGVLTLRELGVLLTAIMVAGRSGSAITAELGSMKMREEVDALRVLGLDPIEVLILPRLLALITAVPILTFIADVSAIVGAALDCSIYAGIPGDAFFTRLHEAIELQTFLVGLSKAPFMALIIGLIAALEGMQVAGSAESLGERTTQAVVKSIFLVILVDGIFAVFFASVGV